MDSTNRMLLEKYLAETADVICLRENCLHAECLNVFNEYTDFTSTAFNALVNAVLTVDCAYGGISVLCITTSLKIISRFEISINNSG